MPPIVIAAAIAAGGAVGGAAISARSSGKAANAQANAATTAAQLQKQSTDEALHFQESQAAEDKRRYDEAQQRNYDQYLRRYRAAQGLGKSIGFSMPDAPDYYGTQGPNRATAQAPAGAATAPSSGNPMDPNYIAQQVTGELAKFGQKPTGPGSGPGDVAYWVKQIQAGKGWEPFWQDRIAQAFQPGGAGGGGSMPASRGVAAYLNPTLGGAPINAAPQADFKLRSIYANL